MRYTFSAADKRMFASTQQMLGGHPEELLRSRMADGVFGPDWGAVDESFLRRVGADELSMLPDFLGSGRTSEGPAPSARVMLSLRSMLLGRGDPGMDVQLRAGLHRLGRAVADLDAACLQSVTQGMPPTWARRVQAAWFRLARLEECRASAAAIRELLGNGDQQ